MKKLFININNMLPTLTPNCTLKNPNNNNDLTSKLPILSTKNPNQLILEFPTNNPTIRC